MAHATHDPDAFHPIMAVRGTHPTHASCYSSRCMNRPKLEFALALPPLHLLLHSKHPNILLLFYDSLLGTPKSNVDELARLGIQSLKASLLCRFWVSSDSISYAICLSLLDPASPKDPPTQTTNNKDQLLSRSPVQILALIIYNPTLFDPTNEFKFFPTYTLTP
ncbi:hypothetical protein PTTG_26070 [Puccinia triticina 1-1 BBBD Race 1]|uniref:Uncharacterized protein n=1 Tax=Puccinia triticina (isolate 1-1 / race 1 (BBBD)) TaxID=630390 RepID=A0A180GXF3_PUCT1|nr:hypothetical protein PTTG_26070 [Puccinia triticina 1-1 BBBD Race 1]